MSGIAGFNFENNPLLKKMCSLIIHRGPDNEGYFTDSTISIGMRRLSIKNLNTENLLVHNEDEDIWVICDGKIYNLIDLKSELENKGHKFYTHVNYEVILHAYEEWGENCVNKLRGVFSFCIYDSRKKILFLARDHIGIKPLYYYFDGEIFIFGSEIKCILCHGIKRVLDKKAFNIFISLGYVSTNHTLFKGIYKVPQSSYLIFNLKSKKIKFNKYWDVNFSINKNKNVEQFAIELKNLIEESVKIRLINDVPSGAFLSGGIDSSAVVGIMSKLMDEPVKTFSIGFEEGGLVDETNYAKFVAEYYNTAHTEMIIKSPSSDLLCELIWHLDDLIADSGIIPIYLMAKHAKEKINLILTGDGADEVFAGYSVYYRAQKFNFSKYVSNRILYFIMKFYNHIPYHKLRMALSYLYQSKTLENRYIRSFLYVSDLEKSKLIPFEVDNVNSMIKKTFIKDLDIINQFTRWELRYQLPNFYNIKADRAFSAASLTGGFPLLDRDIVLWSLKIPPELKLKGNVEKYILRLAMKDILPAKILKRKKKGIDTPINLWLNTGIKEVSGQLLEKLEKRTNLLKPKYINILKKNRFKKLYMNRVWSLIMFELWYETFIENDGLKPIML